MRVPEHPNLTVTAHGLFRALQGFIYGKILMVGTQYLPRLPLVLVEAKEVLNQVEETMLVENALKESGIIGYGIRFILPILGFPLHVSLLLGGKRAHTGGKHIRNHIESIVNE